VWYNSVTSYINPQIAKQVKLAGGLHYSTQRQNAERARAQSVGIAIIRSTAQQH
jgi:hypothetical protein